MDYKIDFNLDFKRNTYPGKFIVIEGIDGSGKTTQANLLASFLKDKGYKTFLTKEPTDGVIGNLIQEVLTGKKEIPMASFQYLFCADRVMHEQEILEMLKNGYYVICDRYFWSSIPYGFSDKESLDYKNEGSLMLIGQSILSMYYQFVLPDITFYLDVFVDTALLRITKKTEKIEIYEKKEKLAKIVKGYQWLVKQFPKEFVVIDGEKEVKKVLGDIINNIKIQNAKIKS